MPALLIADASCPALLVDPMSPWADAREGGCIAEIKYARRGSSYMAT